MKEPRNNVTLQQNGKIINDPSIVSNIFNNYFRTVAMEIGNESPLSEEESLDDFFSNIRRPQKGEKYTQQ